MVQLTLGSPVTVSTPQLLVENSFAPGLYRFQLVVFDSAGQASAPATLDLTVVHPASTGIGGTPISGPIRTGPIRIGPVLPTGPSHIFMPQREQP